MATIKLALATDSSYSDAEIKAHMDAIRSIFPDATIEVAKDAYTLAKVDE